MRVLATAFVFLSVVLASQPAVTSEFWTEVPTANLETGDAGIVILEVQENSVVVDLAASDPDVIHIPIFLNPDKSEGARGVLKKDSQQEEVFMPLVQEGLQGESYDLLVLDQDWPQAWDELVIELDDQDWPQYEDVIIPLAFQDWPQSWLPAELA